MNNKTKVTKQKVENNSTTAAIEQEIGRQKLILATEDTFTRILDPDSVTEIDTCEINDEHRSPETIEEDMGIAIIYGIDPKEGENWFDGYFIKFRNLLWHRDDVFQVGQLLMAMKEKYKKTDGELAFAE